MRRIAGMTTVLTVALAACDHAPTTPLDRDVHLAAPVFSVETESVEGAEWVVEGLGTLGGTTSWGTGINDQEVATGYSRIENEETRAFRWSAETGMVNLGTLGGSWSQGWAVNAAGVVVGWSGRSDGSAGAFLHEPAGSMQELPALEGFPDCVAHGIDDTGRIAGTCYTADFSQARAVIWEDGTVTPLPQLPERPILETTALGPDGSVAGWAYSEDFSDPRAFLWTPEGGIQELSTPEGYRSGAWGVGGSGAVVGQISPGGGDREAVVWDGSGMEQLGMLPGSGWSVAYAMGADGRVVGESVRAFIWSEENGMTDLGTLPGGSNSEARGMNASGVVVGNSSGGDFARQAVLWRPAEAVGPDPDPEECTFDALRALVDELATAASLTSREQRSLLRYLDQAERFVDRGPRHYDRAIERLQEFLLEVEAIFEDPERGLEDPVLFEVITGCTGAIIGSLQEALTG
jgi:probable HAF family extracellular repeat protein